LCYLVVSRSAGEDLSYYHKTGEANCLRKFSWRHI
jgi:hypothetical protein